MSVIIKESKDIDLMAELLKADQDRHANFEPEIFKKYEEENFKKLIEFLVNLENFFCFVAYYNDFPVGCCILQIRKYPETFIEKGHTVLFGVMIAVIEKYKSKGIGIEFMLHNIEFAKYHNINIIETEVWAKNETAVSFFESFNFQKNRYNMRMKLD
jgi:diamine N-acetyltransferase